MIEYVESMTINGVVYGIEDLAATGRRGTHFDLRYKPWVGGCAISLGEATLEMARKYIAAYAEVRLEREIHELVSSIERKQASLRRVRKNLLGRTRPLAGEY